MLVRDNFKFLYIQINFPAYEDYLCSNFKWFDSHAKCFGEKWQKRNFGAHCFLYSCSYFSTNFSLFVTCDMHDALNQKNNSSFDFSLKAILLIFF